MKAELNKKILKIAAVEILLQLGFEKCTEEALNILVEVYSYYIERTIGNSKEIVGILGGNESKEEFISKEEAKSSSFKDNKQNTKFVYLFLKMNKSLNNELLQFVAQQNNIMNLLKNSNTEVKSGNIFKTLKFLPKEQTLRALHKTNNNSNKTNLLLDLEEKNESEEGGEVEIDAFFKAFVEKCEIKTKNITEKIQNRKYAYDLDNVILEGIVPTFNNNSIPLVSNKEMQEVQESFLDDFGKPKRIAIKKKYKKEHPLGKKVK